MYGDVASSGQEYGNNEEERGWSLDAKIIVMHDESQDDWLGIDDQLLVCAKWFDFNFGKTLRPFQIRQWYTTFNPLNTPRSLTCSQY